MEKYITSKRYHEVHWMLLHSRDLEEKSRRTNDVSKIIYCCLELRNILEMIEFHLLLASADSSEHIEIANIAKTHRGNEKANKQLKAISHKSQKFYEVICEVLNQPGVYFDFKKSNEFKIDLSQYLHTNTKTPKEMIFESKFIQDAFSLIHEVWKFIDNSLLNDEHGYRVQNLSFKTLSPEDDLVFRDWKDSKINEEELAFKIKANMSARRSS